MATSMARSGLRAAAAAAFRGGAKSGSRPVIPNKRSFSASAHHDDAYETAKWEKITYAGIVTCTILSIYNLSKGHPHHPDPPAYAYLHIRSKEFPWGPDGLFEKKQHSEH
ncbi:cytochrome c oxidase subunit 6a, mitochondrial [Elaeis guineensis]|uniref:Cytochrome c oxidase subunit 6a, mitochondrial n=1 Tax=Elaeis guineensis var. tenera TaxID=51953 RepID=A0A6I9SGD9_ELAGV|nr:cytochrome c oxidase subunit 6a, mitochondrial [Elaeis guineensis]